MIRPTSSVPVPRLVPFPVRHVVETNQGLCFGRNWGHCRGVTAHLAYLDDDIEVSPDWITGYFEAVNEYGADAVVGPVFPLFTGDCPDYLQARRSRAFAHPTVGGGMRS